VSQVRRGVTTREARPTPLPHKESIYSHTETNACVRDTIFPQSSGLPQSHPLPRTERPASKCSTEALGGRHLQVQQWHWFVHVPEEQLSPSKIAVNNPVGPGYSSVAEPLPRK
jgi:hypothetical protein